MDSDTTIECIDSIMKNTSIDDYRIIVVDNASNNGSYERLLEYYEGQTRIEWIHNDRNYGFSTGNNIGYRYAKNNFSPQYILIGNNDLVFHQADFVQRLRKLGEEYPFYVAGPDIVNLKGEHQNPLRLHLRPAAVIKKKKRNKKIFLYVLKIRKHIPLLQGIVDIMDKIYMSGGEKTQKGNASAGMMKNIVLHGACVIFSQKYIQNHDDAFPEYTFLYMEEDILTLRCEKLGYDTYYFPQLEVMHKEDVSTDSVVKNKLEKNIFVLTETMKSLEIYLQLLEKDVI